MKAYALFAACLLQLATVEARTPWIVLKDCRLVPDAANDADSFHVKAGGKEYIFRLYFVDAPETDTSFPERLQEQASYFELSEKETLQLGTLARRFTREKLARPFTVRTCLQDARGRSKEERYYAFITTSEGDLGELLVANGLVRVYGSEAKPVGLSSPEQMWQRLERLEREAKAAKVGAWGARVDRLAARLPKPPPKTGPNSFDAFFHPERVATPAEAEATAHQPTGKLDANTATSAELLAIPGIGPEITKRIIAARPFRSADELRNVKGIGPKKYERIRPFFAGP
ncbi:MAG TPA: helix-hairpin-helix domain-containing protein [Chthoniobacterales bacterium]|nr:helix-hairpin-helix domain-containing protein [Chthoniobacterales bacterium]